MTLWSQLFLTENKEWQETFTFFFFFDFFFFGTKHGFWSDFLRVFTYWYVYIVFSVVCNFGVFGRNFDQIKGLRKFESVLNLFQVKIFGFFNSVTVFFFFFNFFLRSRRLVCFFWWWIALTVKKTVLFISVFLVERLSYFCIYLWNVETLFDLTENTFREN